MLNKVALASSLGALAGILYITFYLLDFISPAVFEFLFNAQFFGARVAWLLPRETSAGRFLGTLVTVVLSGWIFGYAWAWLYNLSARYVG